MTRATLVAAALISLTVVPVHASGQGTTQNPPAATTVPPVTDEDRRAAFPHVKGHAVHDDVVNSFVLFDRLEAASADRGAGFGWDAKGWVGRDLDRLWFRSEGSADRRQLEEADLQLMYGRGFARWWEAVVGLRQELGRAPRRTWLALGIQGLSPLWFEIEGTLYVSGGGRTLLRFEAEHDLLLTNRLELQPLVEFDVHAKDDAAHRIRAGLSRGEFGLRLRYEIKRELAPYLGVSWERKYSGTAEVARQNGDAVGGVRFVAGLRWWR